MMLLKICAVLPLFYGVLAGPQADQYIDTVLVSALPGHLRMLNLDPASLPDFSTAFEDKVALIGKVKGNANFTNGNLTGLSKGRRMNSCGGPSYKFGALTINCTIGFQDLQTSYNGKMKYGKMPTVPIKGKANVTTTTVFIEASGQPLKITNFHFLQTGNLQMKFTGVGKPLNKFLKVLEDGYRSHVAAQLMNSIAQRYRYALELAMTQVPMYH